MWVIFEYIVLAALVLLSITEFFYPIIVGKPIFGSFRKSTTTAEEAPKKSATTSEDKISEARKKVEEVKEVQEEINEEFKAAKELKKKSDNLLK